MEARVSALDINFFSYEAAPGVPQMRCDGSSGWSGPLPTAERIPDVDDPAFIA